MPLIETRDPIGFVDLGHIPALNVSDVSATRVAAEPPIPREPGTQDVAPVAPLATTEASQLAMAAGLSQQLGVPDTRDPLVRQQISGIPFANPDVPRQLPSGVLATLAAAFRQENLVGAAVAAMADRKFGPLDEAHDPFELIQGTPAEKFPERFFGSRNAEETRAIAAKIQQEVEDRNTLQRAGFGGMAAAMAASILDPSILIPLAAPIKAARGADVAMSMARVGASAAGAIAVQEAGLHALQETRTLRESAYSVGAGFILGGVLGGAISGLSIRQYKAIERNFQKQVVDMPAESRADGFGEKVFEDMAKAPDEFKGTAAGAKSAFDEAGEPIPALQLESTFGVANLFRFMSPVLRGVMSPIQATREATVHMAETSYVFTRNREGWSTVLSGGGAVDTRIKVMGDGPEGDVIRFWTSQYKDYRVGFKATPDNPKAMSWDEFLTQISRSARRHDQHVLPQVAKSAAFARSHHLDPRAKDALKYGLYSEEQLGGKFKDAGPPQEAKDVVDQLVARLGLAGMGPAPAAAPQGQTFKTAKGSTYEVHADGTTTRNKAPRPEHPGDHGPQPQSQKTYYVTAADAQKLGEFQAQGVKKALAPVPQENGGGIGVKYLEGKDAGKWEKRTIVPFKEQPEVGLTPVEVWKDGARVHFGNPITEMGQVAAAQSPVVHTVQQLYEAFARANPELVDALRRQIIESGADIPAMQRMFTKIMDDAANAASLEAKLLEKEGVLSPKVANEVFGENPNSYWPRLWNREKIANDLEYKALQKVIADWLSDAQRRAQVVLAKGGADVADRAKLEEFVGLSRKELEKQTRDIIDNIMGLADGHLQIALPPGVRGSLKSRTLSIPDELVEAWLEDNAGSALRHYTRTVVPPTEVVRMFGSLDLKVPKKAIEDEVDALIAANPKEEQGLRKQMAKDFSLLEKMRDRSLGVYGIPKDPTAFAPRAVKVLKNYNYVTKLGQMTTGAIGDVFRPMMVHSVTETMRDGWAPLVTNLKGVKGSREELMEMGTALDMVRGQTAMQMGDVFDNFGRNTPIERASQWMADRFGYLTGMNWWNSRGKTVAGMITTSAIIRASLAELAGTATAAQITALRASSISENMARHIARQFEKHGSVEDGLYIANRSAWDQEARTVGETFAAAVVRDVDRIIVTPGQEKPFWMSHWAGSFFGQFKSFNFSSMEKTILAGLQKRDAGVFVGAMGMLAMGAAIEVIRSKLNNKELPNTPAQFASTAFERSGLTGILFEVNHFTEAATGGAVGLTRLTGKPVSRFASRNTWDALLGPTAGLAHDLVQFTSAVGGATMGRYDKKTGQLKYESMTEADIRALSRSLAYQNVLWWGWLTQILSRETARSVGAKMDKPRAIQ